MADVTISYNGNEIASMSATGTKTLLTEAKYCEDDITIDYVKPSAPAPNLQAKSNISPTLSSQTVTADAGYDGLSSVQINAMPAGSATTPATTITANPSISVNLFGEITASVSKSQKVTPTVSPGYVSSGTYGTVTVSGSSTEQLTTKAAQTYTPTTTNQTIAAGQYLTGTQTILGDANLLAENIKKDVSIFGITGTLEGGGGGMEYDIVIRCLNAGFGNTVSYYVLEHVPTAADIMAKVSANEPLTGILYCTKVDTVEEPIEYEYSSWPLFGVNADGDGYWDCTFMRPKSTSPYYQSKTFSFDTSNNLYSVSGS